MLTQKETIVLESIKKYILERRYSPTVRDICTLTGIASTSTVHGYLKKLENKGYITKEKETCRSIILLENNNVTKDI